MAETPTRWNLADLVDFEQALAAAPPVTDAQRAAVSAAVAGLEGAAARRTGLRRWLDLVGRSGAGGRFANALSLLGSGLVLLAAIAGASATFGMLANGGVNVVLFLAILIGGQWLVLLAGLVLWLLRARAAPHFGMVKGLLGKLARRFAGDTDWWAGMMDAGGQARATVAWRLARMCQSAGIAFNTGIIASLLGMVWVKDVGFHWESTTEVAMRSFLGHAVDFLAIPWSGWWPQAVPGMLEIEASRRFPDQAGDDASASWWRFLLMATFCWGLMPRVLLWLLSTLASRRALAGIDFQGRAHRMLWRGLSGTRRDESDGKALDGVLVLDVGGSGLPAEKLRPFLLRRLRVNPTSWHNIAVWDEKAEQESAAAISNAPAGVVLVCEGWSLSPARMHALHADLRHRLGTETPIHYLIASPDADGNPVPSSELERDLWTRHVDSLHDPCAEVFAYAPGDDFL
jgi:hypothetical protein